MKKIQLLLVLVFGLFLVQNTYASVDFSHYEKSSWSDGYCYRFEIVNNSNETLKNWDVQFQISDNIRSTYSAQFTQSNGIYTAKGKSWNKNLKSGKNTRFGFCVDSKAPVENVIFSHAQTNIIFENTFTSNWAIDWILETSRKWGFENISVLSGDILEVFYPAGSYKPSADPVGGAGFLKKFESSSDDIYLSYDVKFDNNFNFVKGGKLPGLCGGDCITGSGPRENGFSTRFMWRAEGDLEIYAYIADKSEGYGTSLGRGAGNISAGNWYTITQRVKLNTPGEANGIIEYFVNGESVYLSDTQQITHNPEVKIDGILFSTFFGGGDNSWATPIDTYSYFKNFKVYTK